MKIDRFIKQRARIGLIVLFYACSFRVSGQTAPSTPDYSVVELILAHLTENDYFSTNEESADEVMTDLEALLLSPMDLRSATAQDLKQLPFLSNDQIDEVLLYVNEKQMHSLAELQLVPSLHYFEALWLSKFVYLSDEKAKNEPLYWGDIWRYGKQEVVVQASGSKLEEANATDPLGVNGSYRFNYGNRVEFGLTMDHDAGEPWYAPTQDGKAAGIPRGGIYGFDFYSGYVQVSKIGILQRAVVGDFKASFGQGLTLQLGNDFGGKSAYIAGIYNRKEGLSKSTSRSEYGFLRGVGVTLAVKNWEATLLYSCRNIDGIVENDVFPTIRTTGYHRTKSEIEGKRSVNEQVLGANVKYRGKTWNVGVTGKMTFLSDTLRAKPAYYNERYFQGKRQGAAGVYYEWQIANAWRLYGEVSAAENIKWGWAALQGVRYMPKPKVRLSAIYRYYSPWFNNLTGQGLSETTKHQNEMGLLVGADVGCWKRVHWTAWWDGFWLRGPQYGCDTASLGMQWQTALDFLPNEKWTMQWRVKGKEKYGDGTYSLRYRAIYHTGGLRLQTAGEVNLTREGDEKAYHWGVMFGEDAAFSFQKAGFEHIPLSLSARIALFWAPNYANRFYAYETDVVYRWLMPMLYGKGGRWAFCIGYMPWKWMNLQAKVAQSVKAEEGEARTYTECRISVQFKW